MIWVLPKSAHPGERGQRLGEEAVGGVAPDDGLPGGEGRGGEGVEDDEGLAEQVQVGIDGEDEGQGRGGESLVLDDLGMELLRARLRGDGVGIVEHGLEHHARKRSHRLAFFQSKNSTFASTILLLTKENDIDRLSTLTQYVP